MIRTRATTPEKRRRYMTRLATTPKKQVSVGTDEVSVPFGSLKREEQETQSINKDYQ